METVSKLRNTQLHFGCHAAHVSSCAQANWEPTCDGALVNIVANIFRRYPRRALSPSHSLLRTLFSGLLVKPYRSVGCSWSVQFLRSAASVTVEVREMRTSSRNWTLA